MLISEASECKLECVLAGHNEKSILLAIDQLNCKPGQCSLAPLFTRDQTLELFKQVRFAQLYGMGDHISMALGNILIFPDG